MAVRADRALRDLPVSSIIAAIAAAAGRWCDPHFAPRAALVPRIAERTGYAQPVVTYALDRLFETMTADALRATIAGELGTLAALDGFVRRPGRPDGFARGVERVAIVSSDTTIGVALPAAVFALCARAQVDVKDRVDGLVAAFAATLAGIEPAFAGAFRAQPWSSPGDSGAGETLAAADTVVAYGGAEALVAIRALLGPEARFVPFGHRTSIGYVPAAALADAAAARDHAAGAALDAILYDGEGCLSLHALFVERGAAVTPQAYAALVADGAGALAARFPPSQAPESPGAFAYRKRLAFREANGIGRVLQAGGATIAFDPPLDEPPPLFARTLGIYPTGGLPDAAARLRAWALPVEALGTPHGLATNAVLELAREAGIVRIAPLGRLQAPPLGGEHGGSGRILPFVRWMYRER